MLTFYIIQYIHIYLAANADELLAIPTDKPTHVNRCKADISKEGLPTKDWQKEQITKFTDVRMKISRHFALVKKESIQENIKTPSPKNEYGEFYSNIRYRPRQSNLNFS